MWFWLICIPLLYPYCSLSSLCNSFYLRGSRLYGVIRYCFPAKFAPAICAVVAFDHEMTRSVSLTISRRKFWRLPIQLWVKTSKNRAPHVSLRALIMGAQKNCVFMFGFGFPCLHCAILAQTRPCLQHASRISRKMHHLSMFLSISIHNLNSRVFTCFWTVILFDRMYAVVIMEMENLFPLYLT